MMIPSLTTSLRLGVVMIGFATLAACSSSQPTNFYTLSELAPNTEPSDGEPFRLGVGPIHMPAYLDRPQLVTRSGTNRMNVADFDQWVEPLDGIFKRTLAENLSNRLVTDQIVTLPTRRNLPLDYQVEIDVVRFDADAAGNVVLDVRWRIFESESERLKDHGHSITRRQADIANDYNAIAAAMSYCLGSMSSDIAKALIAL